MLSAISTSSRTGARPRRCKTRARPADSFSSSLVLTKLLLPSARVHSSANASKALCEGAWFSWSSIVRSLGLFLRSPRRAQRDVQDWEWSLASLRIQEVPLPNSTQSIGLEREKFFIKDTKESVALRPRSKTMSTKVWNSITDIVGKRRDYQFYQKRCFCYGLESVKNSTFCTATRTRSSARHHSTRPCTSWSANGKFLNKSRDQLRCHLATEAFRVSLNSRIFLRESLRGRFTAI